MIDSIDELESTDDIFLKKLLSRVTNEEIAIAMHGLSPTLNSRINKSIGYIRFLLLCLSPIKRTSIALSKVEEIHKRIVIIANTL